jgi:hypothetical protein
MLVLYGENDNAWSPAAQQAMAGRLGARRVCIPTAVHSPAVEAPAATASALTRFWDAAEAQWAALTPARARWSRVSMMLLCAVVYSRVVVRLKRKDCG